MGVSFSETVRIAWGEHSRQECSACIKTYSWVTFLWCPPVRKMKQWSKPGDLKVASGSVILYSGLIQSGPPTIYRAYKSSYLLYVFSAIYKGYPFQFHSIYSNRGAHLVATSFYLNLVTFCQCVDNDGIWMGIWWNWNRKSQRFTLETDNFQLGWYHHLVNHRRVKL